MVMPRDPVKIVMKLIKYLWHCKIFW